MPVEKTFVSFDELGPRSEGGFCYMPNKERVLVDERTWREWQELGTVAFNLHIRRDAGMGPIIWSDWQPDPDRALRPRG